MRTGHGFVACVLVLGLATGCPTSGGTGSRADARAVISGRVVLEPDMAGANDYSRVRVELGRGEGGVTPDENGEFSISDLEPDTYNLSVTYIGGITSDATGSAYKRLEQRVVARAGGSIVVGELVPRLSTAPVSGRVRLPDGSAPSDGEVILTPTDARDRTPIKGLLTSGAFTIPNVPVGRHLLSAASNAFAFSSAGMACAAAVTVGEGRESAVDAPDTTVVPTTVGLAPGAGETSLVEGSTWYLLANRALVKVESAYASRYRTWRDNGTAGDYRVLPPDGFVEENLPEGRTTLFLQFADNCTYESPIYSLLLVRDTTPPVVAPLRLGDGSAYALAATMPLHILASDAASPRLQYRHQLCDVAPDSTETCAPATISAAPWVPYALAPVVSFNATAGLKRARVEVRDVSGNATDAGLVDVRLDLAAPTGTLFLNGGTAAEPANSNVVDITLTTSDDESGVVATALGDESMNCTAASYVYPATGVLRFILGAGQGSRSVFACFMDAAGRTSTSAVVSSNSIMLDSVVPLPPSVVVGNGSGWIKNERVSVTVSTSETPADALVINVAGAAVSPNPIAMPASGTATFDVTFDAADGLKALFVSLTDAAGNTSVTSQTGVELDSTAPNTPTVLVAGALSPDANGTVITVRDAVVTLSLADTDARTMRLFERTGTTCGPAICTGNEVPFSVQNAFPLTATLGTKDLCALVCDAAGNGAMGTARVTLASFLAAPRPVLDAIAPAQIVAFSQEGAFTVTGSGIAADTKVQVGDFLLECTSPDDSNSQRDCQSNDVAGSCDTTCTVPALPDGVLRYAGNYVVRLITPEPVVNGQTTSANALVLSVVAPVPVVSRMTPRGARQVPQQNSPLPRNPDVTLTLCAHNLMANAQFRLGTNFGTLLENRAANAGECPATADRLVRVLIATEGLAPLDLEDHAFIVSNPPPGGGDVNTPFGFNALVLPCEGTSCVSNLRGTRPPVDVGRGVSLRAEPPVGAGHVGLAFQGASAAALLGKSLFDSEQFTRVKRGHGSVLPRPLDVNEPMVELDDRRGLGPATAMRPAIGRGSGTFTVEPEVSPFSGNAGPPLLVDVGSWNGTGPGAPDGRLDLIYARPAQRLLDVQYSVDGGGWVLGQQLNVGKEGAGMVVAGDVDGDGDTDLVTICDPGNPFSRQSFLVTHLQRANGVFAAPLLQELDSFSAVGRSPMVIAMADLDLDGFPDVLFNDGGQLSPVANPDDLETGLHIYRGRGNGSFDVGVASLTLALGDVTQIRVDDITLDGIPDIAVVGYAGVAFVTGNGSVRPSTLRLLRDPGVTEFYGRGVDIVDANADGAPDVVSVAITARTTGVGHEALTWLGRGDGTLSDAPVVTVVSYSADRSAAWGEFNGDGIPDLAHIGYQSGQQGVDLVRGRGDGTFEFASHTPVTAAQLGGFFAGDYDLDGALDIVMQTDGRIASLQADGRIAVLHADPGAHAGRPPLTTTGIPGASDPNYGDFDRDGIVDRYTLDAFFGVPMTYSADVTGDGLVDLVGLRNSSPTQGTMYLFSGGGTGSFNMFSAPQYAGSTRGAVVREFTGDDLPDVAVGYVRDAFNETCATRLELFGNTGSFSVTSLDTEYLTYQAVQDVQSADMDSDGDLDVVMAFRASQFFGCPFNPTVGSCQQGNPGGVVIFHGDGQGQFTSPSFVYSGECVPSVGVGDVNGDGRPDLFVATADGNLPGQGFVLLQQADGSFSGGSGLFLQRMTTVRLADINGDGPPDVVSYNAASGFVNLMVNSGDGFANYNTEFLAAPGGRMVIADADGDGTTDVNVRVNDAVITTLLPSPGTWVQELLALPEPANPSARSLVSSGMQVQRVGIRARVSLPAGVTGDLAAAELHLTAPNGEQLVLKDASATSTCDPDWTGKRSAVVTFPTTGTCADLSSLVGLQPRGEWLLEIQGLAGAVLDEFAIIPVGGFNGPAPGTAGGVVDRIVIPPNGTGTVVHGRTLGIPDGVQASCGGSTAGDHRYELTLAANATVNLRVIADFDSVLELQANPCDAATTSVVTCNAAAVTGRSNPAITNQALTAGTYCIVVDGEDAGGQVNHGEFDLFVKLAP